MAEVVFVPGAKARMDGVARELRAGCKDNDGAPTARGLRCLGKLAGDELMERHADGVWRIAIPVYLETLGVYLERMAVGSPGVRGDMTDPAAPATPQCLLDWVLLPFHETSAVFGASGGLYVRDATALLALARCFSNKEFPRTDICPVPLRSRSWEEQVYKGDHQAVLLVGRLWLFGDSAVNDWCHKKARFGFIRHDKPEDCQPPRSIQSITASMKSLTMADGSTTAQARTMASGRTTR